jgi:NADH:ubiquinone oxidoreductase subunit K
LYTKWIKGSSGLWVNLIHILLVAPVLFIIGYYGKATTRAFFEIILLLGFAALGYNVYNLYIEVTKVTDDST